MRTHTGRWATILGVGLFLSAPPSPLDAQGRAFQPNDWHKVTTVGSAAMSPDGSKVAFVVTTVVESDNRRHSEVWVVNTAGGDPVRYTAPGYESSSPRWSDDGSRLIFNSTRPGGRSPWALRMDQPGGEAAPYQAPQAGSRTADGKTVVWTEGGGGAGFGFGGPPAQPEPAPAERDTPDPYGKMAPTARPPFDAITKPVEPSRFDGMQFTQQRIKANGQGFVAGPRQDRVTRPAQLFIQTEGGEKRSLVNQAWSPRSAVVSPDGRWVAFVADAGLRADSIVTAEGEARARLPYDAVRDETPTNDSDIYVLATSGGEPRKLGEWMGSEGSLAWSPDGRMISYTNRASRTSQSELYIVPATGGEPVSLTAGWRYEPGGYDWLPSGIIAMNAEIGGRSGLFHIDPRTRQMKEVLGGRRRMSGFSWDRRGSRVAFVATSTARPTELFLANADGSGERQLTRFNDTLNSEVAWSDSEVFTYESVGGVEVEGWLMKPHGYEAAKKYPLVLYIHGGPHSAYGENWFDEFQNLAGAGMFVLYTNPRGSSGYGADFTYSTRGRWFAEDYEDLMKAVDIVSRRPDVDSTRMGVSGGSYGGVMTAWVTVKTDRFKAAQLDRMISNWWSWYGTSDAQGLTEFEFFGKPWDNPVMYDTLSPIRYLPRVKTPSLLVQSEEDHRTPMTDAEQWFLGLKQHGVPAEFVRYPRSTHDLSRTGEPWLLVDRLGRLRQWFSHWLTPPAGARVTSGSP
ncbi:MAG: S9 family peptidase [Gemmatimonadota bacterium]|nr:S9 family peptidase [Gemmatimonadota bacterium]